MDLVLPRHQPVRAHQHQLGSSADPDLEQQILDDVGSYGRQIGQISDARYVLFAHKSLDKFDPDERKAIAAFQRQVESVNALKDKRERRLALARPA